MYVPYLKRKCIWCDGKGTYSPKRCKTPSGLSFITPPSEDEFKSAKEQEGKQCSCLILPIFTLIISPKSQFSSGVFGD